MRCVNIDANNHKRFYTCITFDAIIRNEKTQAHPVNNVHCCKLVITQKFDEVTNCLYPNG